MKKGLLTLAVMLSVIMLVCAGVVACKGHEHDYKWDNDDTNHWQVCSCGDKTEEEEHDLSYNATTHIFKCDVCGYEKEEGEHQHESPLTHYVAKDATCTDTGNIEYWQCSLCEAYFTDEFGTVEVEVYDIMIRSKGHGYDSEWDYNDTEHWHNPTCEHKDSLEPKDKAAHRFTNGICTCGYTQATEGLELTKSEDGQSYIVTGLGDATTKSIVIPAIHEGLPVTAIGDNAFYYSEITSVTIPDSVKSIGIMAFAECEYLSTIRLGKSITKIGLGAFYWTNISSITLPDTLTVIEEDTFSRCESLTSIIIPEGVTTIESGAFESCDSLISVTIPRSVTSIGERAFTDCPKLLNITYLGSAAQWAEIAVADNWKSAKCQVTYKG